jgi:hypothetical protein
MFPHAMGDFDHLRYDEIASRLRLAGLTDEEATRWWSDTATALSRARFGLPPDPHLEEIASRLRRAGLGEAEQARWWFQAIPDEDGKRPLDLVEAGDYRKISRLITALEAA